MVPSPKVPTYDLQPEMSASGVAKEVKGAHLSPFLSPLLSPHPTLLPPSLFLPSPPPLSFSLLTPLFLPLSFYPPLLLSPSLSSPHSSSLSLSTLPSSSLLPSPHSTLPPSLFYYPIPPPLSFLTCFHIHLLDLIAIGYHFTHRLHNHPRICTSLKLPLGLPIGASCQRCVYKPIKTTIVPFTRVNCVTLYAGGKSGEEWKISVCHV